MYDRYWRFNRMPFGIEVNPDLFFPGRSHRAALLKLQYLVENRKSAAVLAGPAGSGKSFLLQLLAQQLEEHCLVVRVAFPQLIPGEVLAFLAVKLGADESMIHAGASLDVTLRHIEARLQQFARNGRYVVIAIDEAHLIEDRRVFQSLQHLLNFQEPGRCEFSLVFSGQLELIGRLARTSQLDEHFAFQCVLQPLSPPEVADYVQHRLQAAGATEPIFDGSALRALFELSGGLPRRLNRLCDLALLVGYAEDLSQLTATQIEAVAEELTGAIAA